MNLKTLIDENIQVLRQGVAVLTQLPEGRYAQAEPAVCSTGIGGMMRHLLDFYGCFLAGLPSGRVDYDARQRDVVLERDVNAAVRRIESVTSALARLAPSEVAGDAIPANRPLQVCAEGAVAMTGVDCPAEPVKEWVASSVARELKFLLSHTVHHYALIAAMLRLRGGEPPAEFGVAPSTLTHMRATQAGAVARAAAR